MGPVATAFDRRASASPPRLPPIQQRTITSTEFVRGTTRRPAAAPDAEWVQARMSGRAVSRSAALFDDLEALSECLGRRQQIGIAEHMGVLPLIGLLVAVRPPQGNPVSGNVRSTWESDNLGENRRRYVAAADCRYRLGR